MSKNVFQSPSPAGKSKYKYYKPAPPNYEGADPNMPLPPKGVPVYVDHPFFERDELFSSALVAAALARHLAVMNGLYKSDTGEMLRWLQGEIPIPEKMLETMITNRAAQAKKRGIEVEPARAPDLAETA